MTSDTAPHRSGSQMAFETGEAPAAVARLLDTNMSACLELGKRLEKLQPPVIVTCARGSSDHAATYGKYLFETQLGIPVSSFACDHVIWILPYGSISGQRVDRFPAHGDGCLHVCMHVFAKEFV